MKILAIYRDVPSIEGVHVRRILEYLSRFHDVYSLSLKPGGKFDRALNLLRGLPPEVSAFATPPNRAAVREEVRRLRPDCVYLLHEALFPLDCELRVMCHRRVHFEMNSVSLLASSDPSWKVRLLTPWERWYERRYYGTGGAHLVCVSTLDKRALNRDKDPPISAPGALPARHIRGSGAILEELVVLGGFEWWRKKRDLITFAQNAPGVPIFTVDNETAAVFNGAANSIPSQGLDWSAGLRFGVIADRFQGGFKLKSLEYIALNCIVISWCDLFEEFADLPHADEFVRYVRSRGDMEAIMEEFRRKPHDQVVARFRVFQDACTQRYDWDNCLAAILPPS